MKDTIRIKGDIKREPKPGFGFIYVYHFMNGKSYVGQTRNKVQIRNLGHKHGKTVVDRVIREVIDHEEPYVLEILGEYPLVAEKDSLDDMEKFYIKQFNTLYPNGYNMTEGGVDGSQSEETIMKRVMANSGEFHWRFGQNIIRCIETGKVYDTLTQAFIELGIKQKDLYYVVKGIRETAKGYHFEYVDDEKRAEAEATRARLDVEKQERLKQYYEQNHDIMVEKGKKLAESNIGRKYTPEHCENISKALTGRKLSPEHVAKMKGHSGFEGKHHTEEEKKRRSEAMKGENNPFYGKKGADASQSKPVIAYVYPSMEVIGEFVNQKQASEHFEVPFQTVSACCRGKIKSTKQKTLTFRFKSTNV